MRRQPRATAWVLLLASAAAVFLIGLTATALIFGGLPYAAGVPPAFWPALAIGCVATLASVTLRGLRWAFLLRRADARIPLRDALIGYFAGLSLLFAPLLVGEIAVRAYVLRARCRTPVAATVAVNLWERLLDIVALSLVALIAAFVTGSLGFVAGVGAGVVVASSFPPVRRYALAICETVSGAIGRRFDRRPTGRLTMAGEGAWWTALATSVAAWMMPPIALLTLTRIWGSGYTYWDAAYDYSTSSGIAAFALAPGGVLVIGARLLTALASRGLGVQAAAMSTLGARLATAGAATAFGVVMLAVHWRTSVADSSRHFDDIADAYDVQIPESRRLALLQRKTEMMRDVLGAARLRGLDVGCGQGAYVQRMRALGYETSGLDASPQQVAIASRKFQEGDVVKVGSALAIPAPDESFDFVYTINVLHHLPSVDDQRRAFVEMLRVLRPGGRLFVHEINTRNVLFRFYMGYVFPSLNCIDEGTERWLLPNRLGEYTPVALDRVYYFTFFPDFLPGWIVRLLAPIERRLERSRAAGYSAHYMASWRKPEAGGIDRSL